MQSKASDIDSIAKRTIRLAWQGVSQSGTVSEAQNYSTSMQSDGSWDDITYNNDASLGVWDAIQHLNRLTKMTMAYTAPWSSLQGDSSLYSKIIKGLSYWENLNLSSTSWWFNDIAAPKALGIIMGTGGSTISVYPNPVSSTLNISAPSTITNIRIIDANGVVRKLVVFDGKENLKSAQINVSWLNSGTYILATDTKNGSVITKFLKQ